MSHSQVAVVRRAREMVTEVLSVRSVPVRINAVSRRSPRPTSRLGGIDLHRDLGATDGNAQALTPVRTWSWYPAPPASPRPLTTSTLAFTTRRTCAPAVKLPNGEFADLPVADRARRLLMVAEGPLAGAPGVFSALETETDAPCRRDGMVCRRGD